VRHGSIGRSTVLGHALISHADGSRASGANGALTRRILRFHRKSGHASCGGELTATGLRTKDNSLSG
jgi:hypothetical protein